MEKKIFEPFKVKDIVFMALLSAVALCTASVMAIVAHIYIYGLAQLVTAFQFAFFSSIALMKVRKVGTLFIFGLFTGLFELFMAPVMFISSVLTALLLECIVVLLFRNYKNSLLPVFIASALIIPATMPFNLLYYRLFSQEMWDLFFASGFKVLSIVFILGSVLVGSLGSLLGIKVSNELLKAGVLKQ
ncbi:MAG: MptD family putative ECF transporter S component [Treponema sp.]|uniref:MptD family putative ECF transporter S component n=1 Tax=Treponema sp. TaxID=166 RepID=UPI0025DBF746|nr:MptD family putative ECF transporter S component [Treponema sp.]MBQ9283386.1 MptD family putative ECF transporter S component [Treponema sp.]